MAGKDSTRARALRTVAIHEAGHAVVAHFQHVKIRDVTIVPTKTFKGLVRRTHVRFVHHGMFDDSLAGSDRAERHIRVAFAGQIAQRKFAPRSKWKRGGAADHALAMELFWPICHADREARDLHLQMLWREAECLVDRWWKVIRLLADELIEHKTLTRDEAREVIEREILRY